MSAEVLAKKKRIRAGHRASATRMITQTETLLSEETPNVVKLSQSKLSLQEKLETIKVLDGEMLELMEDEDLAEEVQQADGFKEGIYGAMIKIDKCVKMLCVHTPVTTSELRTPPAAHNKVKLPKLVLRPFNGDITTWTAFWESFDSSIHKSRDLSDIDKFNYLNSLLTGTAREAVAGLSLSEKNYVEAIAILQKRFGNVQRIKARHMDVLMNVEAVNSSRDLKSLRRLHDLIESHVRSLSALGIDPATYGGLLSSTLLNKLPSDLQLMISRKLSDTDWDLTAFLKLMGDEIEARERIYRKEPRSVTTQLRKTVDQAPPTLPH